MLLMKDRSFLYELRAYLIYVKVQEKSDLDLHLLLIYICPDLWNLNDNNQKL